VNKENETLQENARVQECLAVIKQERKPIVRYIQVSRGTLRFTPVPNGFPMNTQLVENEDMIGTLIETNERIITALEMYDGAVSFKFRSLPPYHTLRSHMHTSYHPTPPRHKPTSRTSRRASPRLRSKIPSSQSYRKNNAPPWVASFGVEGSVKRVDRFTLTYRTSTSESWGRIEGMPMAFSIFSTRLNAGTTVVFLLRSGQMLVAHLPTRMNLGELYQTSATTNHRMRRRTTRMPGTLRRLRTTILGGVHTQMRPTWT